MHSAAINALASRLILMILCVIGGHQCILMRSRSFTVIRFMSLPAYMIIHREQGFEETVKLIDFGVARSEVIDGGRRTDRGVLIGTLKYMAPEQALCEEGLDYRADLWSLAVIVYCLLTGKGPFSGSTREEMVLAIWSSALTHDHHLVDVHVANLRAKVDRPFGRASIETVRGIGFRLSEGAA